MAVDKKISDKVTKLTNQAMDKLVAPCKKLYTDLGILKDLRLGHLLSHCSHDEIDYVIENIETYNDNLSDFTSFTGCFPKLAHLEKGLINSYPHYHDSDINYAPDTIVFLKFNEILQELYRGNGRVGILEPIKVTINVYPYQITDLVKDYGEILAAAFQHLAVFEFITVDPMQIPSATWSTFDIIYIRDIATMCSNQSTPWKEPMNAGEWLTKRIYAPPYISPEAELAYKKKMEDEEPPVFDDWRIECLDNTEKILRCCCDFSFIHLTIVTEG